jgi:ferredoxin-NADP reductase
MERAALSRGLSARRTWRPALLVDRRAETATAYTLVFELDDWPGHLGGQHVDLRLTAADGYQAARSYSLAAPADHTRVEVTVQRVADGEVSTYLTDEIAPGDMVELRGPLGGWFVWTPQERAPVVLVGGGSGVVPLMAMVRARAAAESRVPFRLLASVRTPEDRLYAEELRRRRLADPGLDVTWLYTRRAEAGDGRPAARIGADDLGAWGWPPDFGPLTYVCGPTGFVETVSDLLVGLGHDPARIRTERFG